MMDHRDEARTMVRLFAISLLMMLLGWTTRVTAEEATPDASPTHTESAIEEAAGEDVSDTEDDDGSANAQESAPSPPPATNTGRPKFYVHGFLTQAYATGNFQEGRFPTMTGEPAGPTPEEISLGIPEDGTASYRNVAIQFRYEMTPKDIMIFQFSSRALGDSPISDIEDEVELDWAFYERRLTDHTSIKVGRVQIPFGIFNEFRDVGTLLPFYRPAFVFYREGAFTTETVDGLLVSHTFWPASDWSLEANIYGGEFDLVELDPFSEEAFVARSEDSWGTQFWLNTPIYGLRLGYGTQKRNLTEGAEGITKLPGDSIPFDEWLASIDAAFNKWVFRAEFRSFEVHNEPLPALQSDDFSARFDSYYAQVGFHPIEKFRIYYQIEFSDVYANTPLFTEPQDFTIREDQGIALNYFFSPNVVLKVEYHEVEGKDQSFVPVFFPGPPFFQLQPIFADIDNGDYSIISLSATF